MPNACEAGDARVGPSSLEDATGVREGYDITAGMVLPTGGIKHTYALRTCRELPTEIGKLKAGDEKAVLRFARKYGHLGYEPFADAAEPLAWIWAHAYIIRVCLTLTWLLEHGSEEELEDYVGCVKWGLTWEPMPDSETIIGKHIMTYHDDILAYNRHQFSIYLSMLSEENPFEVWHAPQKVMLDANPPHSPRNLARRMRSALINKFMGRIERQLWDSEEYGPCSFYTLERPISWAYWHLADMVEDRHATIRCCASCHQWFVPTDHRQRFCPPGPGQVGSRCAARERMRAKRRQSHTNLPFREQY